ncbi:HD-GYP domain-containing protein [Anaeroselena agilis]|uniref:HD-GYP domain-containing protein n=1 Tax=Anaeroselena agilis TaxID=3063788 RepID=A0ABU3P437_9FIRM|nr:HD-GYP domain-containing protein [Selenomonadales bacterium 4137-cl]
MRKISVQDLSPGMLIDKEVISEEGVVLLERGTRLTHWQIANLRNWRVPCVFVDERQPPLADMPSPYLSTAAFLGEYVRTVDAIRHTFEHIRVFREVPILEMEELVDQRITLLAETVGVLDYLYEIRLHSDHTFQHSLNVAIIAAVLGRWRKYKGAQLKDLVLAGLLHDIGKLFVPQTVLDKPSTLSPREFEVIKRHPHEGYTLIHNEQRLSEGAKLGILQHHERCDGSGYPGKLAGDQIHPFAQIIAIADIYNAMTSDRTYRRRLTPLAALEAIADQMHAKLETGVCLTFLDNMREHFTGNNVILSTGQRAKIIVLNTRDRYWTKPVVCIPSGMMLDLQKEDISIVELIEEG